MFGLNRLSVFVLLSAICGAESFVRGATFVAELTEIVADESGEYASAEFDFGTSFSRIDQVSIELTAPFSLSSGYHTGHTSYLSALEIDLFERGGEPVYDLHLGTGHGGVLVHTHTLRVELGDVVAGIPKTMLFPGGTWTSLSMLPESGWPAFLLAGRGDARLSLYRGVTTRLDDTWKTEETFQAPETLTSVYLIVEGVAVPEPATCTLLGGLIAATAMAYRRRVC